MPTMEQLGYCDPEPDPVPIRQGGRHYHRDPAVDEWQKAQDQYEAHLDRLAGEDR